MAQTAAVVLPRNWVPPKGIGHRHLHGYGMAVPVRKKPRTEQRWLNEFLAHSRMLANRVARWRRSKELAQATRRLQACRPCHNDGGRHKYHHVNRKRAASSRSWRR